MAQPYVGEIRLFAGNFAPAGWVMCDGSLYPIAENEVLFAVIGKTYGGDGESTYGVPDLRGRVPVHQGQGPGITQSYTRGQQGGSERVTLTTAQIPAHNHPVGVSTQAAGSSEPTAGALLAKESIGSAQAPTYAYRNNAADPNTPVVAATALKASAVVSTGGNSPHENRQPYLGMNYIMSSFGLFPSP